MFNMDGFHFDAEQLTEHITKIAGEKILAACEEVIQEMGERGVGISINPLSDPSRDGSHVTFADTTSPRSKSVKNSNSGWQKKCVEVANIERQKRMGKKREKSDTEPQFPYTTSPTTLRKLLKEIPKRPKPGKLMISTLKTWNVTAANDGSPIRVLRNLGMVGASGEPLQPYIDYMKPVPAGPTALGTLLKEKYKGLFEASHEPHKDTEALKNYFNIHAGGSEQTIALQVQTFKALQSMRISRVARLVLVTIQAQQQQQRAAHRLATPTIMEARRRCRQ